MCGVKPPRLLQGHSPTGEPHCTALVQTSRSSGEVLVNGSEPPASLGLAHPEAGAAHDPRKLRLCLLCLVFFVDGLGDWACESFDYFMDNGARY